MLTLYRLVHQDHVEEVWTGKRASKVQVGRWHLPGIPMVYLASTLSQAVLLHQLQVQNRQVLSEFRVFSLQVPDDVVIGVMDVEALPTEWQQPTASQLTRQLGTDWWNSKIQLLLRVPLNLLPGETHCLLNVQHDDFHRCTLQGPTSLPLNVQ